MSDALKLVIVDPCDSSREDLKKTLLSLESAWLEAECSRYEFFQDVVEQSVPDIGIINLDSNPEQALQLVQSVSTACPDCNLIVSSESNDGQLILSAIRAGAKEFVNSPISASDLVAAMDRMSRHFQSNEATQKKRTGKVIAVCGAGGGVGATSVAVNLSTMLAAHENTSVALADLDLALGDADVFLDMLPEHTLVDLVQNTSRLDIAFLKKSLAKHESGIYLLPRPVHLDEMQMVGVHEFSHVVGLMKASFNYILLDLSKSYSALDLEALHQADSILLVTQLDLPCLRNVVRILMSLREMNLDDKVQIVVNRVGQDSGQISLKKAKETLGREIYWQIPNDFSAMVEFRNNGVPLSQQAPKSAITQSLRGLAERVAGIEAGEGEKRSNRGSTWLGFLKQKTH
jgi:pilus assembly protein CpaE